MATASLPMYDLPDIREAQDSFWADLAQNLIENGIPDVPQNLTRGRSVHDLWSDPDLLISQCCGYDITHRYSGCLRPVATPLFAAEGCLAENYCSTIVVAEKSSFTDVREMAGTIAVINGPESHSGMSSLRHLIARHHHQGRFFSDVKISGSHIASLHMIRNHQADIAAIDSVTLTLLQLHNKEILTGIKAIGTTYTAPAPPYVVRASLEEDQVKKIRQSLIKTFEKPTLAACRARLLLNGITMTQTEDYWLMDAFKDHATKYGFPSLQ